MPLTELEEVPADRRLRLAIKPFLDADETQVQLADPDPAVRRGAAVSSATRPRPPRPPSSRKRCEKESDRWVRLALAEALALIHLANGTPAQRTAAARSLGDLHSESAVAALQRLATDGSASPAEREAALHAIRGIERWGLLTPAIEIAFQGASLGSILLLMALGLAIVFGLMGVINMAHGELMALGAYATFVDAGLVRRRTSRRASTTTSWSRCRSRSWWRRPRASCSSAG